MDTEASRSVFPHPSSAKPNGPHLLIAASRPAKAWGFRAIPLHFGNCRFQFLFLFATVDRSILEADFLAEFDLLVDPARFSNHLICNVSSSSEFNQQYRRPISLQTSPWRFHLVGRVPYCWETLPTWSTARPPCGTCDQDGGLTLACPPLLFRSVEIGRCQSRVSKDASSWNYSMLW